MEDAMIKGSCLCGAIQYQLTQRPGWAHHCHCSRCRKVRGAAFATNAFAPLDAFAYTRGEDRLRSYKPPEAERFTHVFCEVCGSSLPFRNTAGGRVIIPMGSLDDDPGHAPDAHIFVGSKAPWFRITDSLPQHTTQIDLDAEAKQ